MNDPALEQCRPGENVLREPRSQKEQPLDDERLDEEREGDEDGG